MKTDLQMLRNSETFQLHFAKAPETLRGILHSNRVWNFDGVLQGVQWWKSTIKNIGDSLVLLMEEIPDNHLGCLKPCNGIFTNINWWTPDFSHQQYHTTGSPPSNSLGLCALAAEAMVFSRDGLHGGSRAECGTLQRRVVRKYTPKVERLEPATEGFGRPVLSLQTGSIFRFHHSFLGWNCSVTRISVYRPWDKRVKLTVFTDDGIGLCFAQGASGDRDLSNSYTPLI